MSHLLVVQTGGTIDKEYPRNTGGYAFEIGDAAVKRVLERANLSVEVTHRTVCRKDSQDISDADRQRLVDCIQESGCDRVLVTHGTDTMIETARYLAATIHDKTVVLCGSLRPEAFRTSDADFNVGCAVGALGVLPAGVFVVMSGRAFAHDAVSRDPQTGRFVAK